MYIVLIRQHDEDERYYLERLCEAKQEAEAVPEAVPEVDLDPIYAELMDEKRAESGSQDEQHWFDETLDKLGAEAQSKSEKLKSEGDEAAKMFEQFGN